MTSQNPRATGRIPARVLERIRTPWQKFTDTEASGGVILIAAAALAFALANSPLSALYFGLKEVHAGFDLGPVHVHMHLGHWVNDLLMALFFFVVGLEIKREFLVGELADAKQAALPIAGAAGGMAAPALIFVAFTWGGPGVSGWGVPVATDIAFAVGILALLGERVPVGLKVFLLALAIADDLGGVLVIALFYTDRLDLGMLALALLAWGAAMFYGRGGGMKPLVYALIGAVTWYFTLKSGVHATIAGVLMAFAVPMRHGMSTREFGEALRSCDEVTGDLEDVEAHIQQVEDVIDRAQSPLHAMEHNLQPYVAYFVMPVFAFFNAGVSVLGGSGALIGDVSVGVFLGLVLGKPLGITLVAWLTVVAGFAVLPRGATWLGLAGVGMVAGIGFTVALFIAGLAFPDPALLDEAKVGVLAASVVAALAGLGFLHLVLPRRAEESAFGATGAG